MPPAAPFRDAAIAAAKAGKRPGEIAAEFDAPVSAIYQILKDARRGGHAIPRFNTAPRPRPGECWLRVRVAVATRRKLERAAEARGLSVSELSARLLDAVASDGLIDAVLDDGEGSA
ncbi:hypothetical protein SAMN05444722_1702 [Rhodovulum sp. ES.010]|uniref:hypothetical protein n=1 Tax=Rhodovulum sp. ES.010 TaxID=1882821 RepID=UPI0009269751|nr:hypothetical protein [Rhodovulum sp. ES.010]SIO36723.1 hypothetical protein SAMN05444722_1702 [Rhodovulum sp. ES.010]